MDSTNAAMNGTTSQTNGGIQIEDSELHRYQSLISQKSAGNGSKSRADDEELRNAPLIWWDVKAHRDNDGDGDGVVQQYAVLGHDVIEDEVTDELYEATPAGKAVQPAEAVKPVFLNTKSPWSAFLCGSQGSGKSHTLSCMLENCLLDDPDIGKNPNPLAGLVLHYDGARGSGVCEAAYLCSQVKTTVLVSASNYGNLKKRYEDMAKSFGANIEVKKLLISPSHLDTERVKTLMAVGKEGEVPLYIQTLVKIIRDIAIAHGGVGTFNYVEFKCKLTEQLFSEKQNQPLQLRLDLLESFLDIKPARASWSWTESPDYLIGTPGELVIVDLTDPVVDVDAACVLFDTCLSIFLSQTHGGKIVALDEAHNYLLDGNAAAKQFTGKLLKSIREQRHQGTRIVIATQEPTLDTKLLDLCSITMVHRCSSPAWFEVLKKHVAGLYLDGLKESQGLEKGRKNSDQELFLRIVELGLGQSLLFCPTAAIGVDGKNTRKMTRGFVKFQTRKRLTADGGLTVLADETYT